MHVEMPFVFQVEKALRQITGPVVNGLGLAALLVGLPLLGIYGADEGTLLYRIIAAAWGGALIGTIIWAIRALVRRWRKSA